MKHHIVPSIVLVFGLLTSLTGCRNDAPSATEQATSPVVTEQTNPNWTEAEQLVTSTVADVSAISQSIKSTDDISRGQDKIDYLVETLELPELSESEQDLIRERVVEARTKAATHFQNLTAESNQFSRPADFVRQQVSLSAWAVNVGI